MESLFGLNSQIPNTTIEMVAFFAVPSLILAAGTFDDLRSQKIHNKLILILLPIAIISQFLGFGTQGLALGFLAFGLALCFSIPMVLSGMLGGGDMKLYAVFAMATNFHATLWVGVYSLFWGALFGIFRSILMGQGLVLVMNVVGLMKNEKPESAHLTKIPYSVALLMGWMTYLSLQQLGGRV